MEIKSCKGCPAYLVCNADFNLVPGCEEARQNIESFHMTFDNELSRLQQQNSELKEAIASINIKSVTTRVNGSIYMCANTTLKTHDLIWNVIEEKRRACGEEKTNRSDS